MEYVEHINTADIIAAADKALERCLSEFFSEISLEEAAHPEILDDKYTEDILLKIQAEYYMTLKSLWDHSRISRLGSFSKYYDSPEVGQTVDMQALDKAYKDARRRTLWEKLTRTNHKDVLEYKQLLRQYSEALLSSMRDRFSMALSKLRVI